MGEAWSTGSLALYGSARTSDSVPDCSSSLPGSIPIARACDASLPGWRHLLSAATRADADCTDELIPNDEGGDE